MGQKELNHLLDGLSADYSQTGFPVLRKKEAAGFRSDFLLFIFISILIAT
jgi:hypothetical protein